MSSPAKSGKEPGNSAVMVRVIFSGIFSAALGVFLAFVVLARQPPQKYAPTPEAKSGKMPPPPAGVWYWAGADNGNWQAKETSFLAGGAHSLSITDGEFNGWVKDRLKPPAPEKPVAAKPAADARDKAKQPEPSGQSFGLVPGVVNFHSFQIPGQADGTPSIFQVAVPLKLTVLGTEVAMLCQMRGTFAPGTGGPRFEANYFSLGCARLPLAGVLAGRIFSSVGEAFMQSDEGKKLVAAWASFSSATPRDGELVLEGK